MGLAQGQGKTSRSMQRTLVPARVKVRGIHAAIVARQFFHGMLHQGVNVAELLLRKGELHETQGQAGESFHTLDTSQCGSSSRQRGS